MVTRLIARVSAAVVCATVMAPSAFATPLAEQGCAALGGTVTPENTCAAHTETPQYTIDISYPLDYPDAKAVSDYLIKDRDQFVDWFTVADTDGRSQRYQYDVTAKTYHYGKPIKAIDSLVLTINEDTGAAHQGHPATSYEAFNFNFATDRPFTFDTLFKPGSKPLDVITPFVRKRFDAPNLELLASDCRNFALTDDAVIFFFGEGQLIPADNTGPRQISVPLADLQPLMAV